MVFKKIFGLSLVGLLLLVPNNTFANTIETPIANSKSENVSEAKVPESEVRQLEEELGLNPLTPISIEPDRYEPNNTIETAYPYRDAEKIACSSKIHYSAGHFNCFYTPNMVSTIDDLDFYEVHLQPGNYYVAALKNVPTNLQIVDIRLYYQKSDGSWWYKYPTQKDRGTSIFHFTANYSTYYVRLSGDYAPGTSEYEDGIWNWFAVERDGTIDERVWLDDPKPSCSLQ